MAEAEEFTATLPMAGLHGSVISQAKSAKETDRAENITANLRAFCNVKARARVCLRGYVRNYAYP